MRTIVVIILPDPHVCIFIPFLIKISLLLLFHLSELGNFRSFKFITLISQTEFGDIITPEARFHAASVVPSWSETTQGELTMVLESHLEAMCVCAVSHTHVSLIIIIQMIYILL